MKKSYLEFGLKEPVASFRYLFGGRESVKRHQIAKLLCIDESELRKYENEISGDVEFKSKIQNSLANIDSGQISSPETLYVICRSLKPQIVVETGVASGMSSAYILKALEQNGFGKLYSIDYPNYDKELVKREEKIYKESKTVAIIPEGKQPGYLVPIELRDRWDLRLGLTRELLPPLLNEVKELDIFLHDSEHTYENMNFEYRTVWPKIRNGGVLISHDVNWSTAFNELCRDVNKKPVYLHFSDIAGIRK